MSANILLIDLSSIAHQMFHVSGNDPNPDATSIKTVERVRGLASGQPHVAICLDTPPYFRREISPDYKAQRDKENNAVIAHQIATAVDVLKADGFPVWGAKGYEADDVIATATMAALGVWATTVGTVTIASSDKDLLQLVEPDGRVVIKSLKDGTTIDAPAVVAKFGVAPHQVRDYLALVGDASDNVKGADGIGAKKAAALLQKFGNLEDLYVALTEHGTKFTPGLATALREFQPRMQTVRDLITLRTDAPIAFDEVFKERVQADIAVFGEENMERQGEENAPVDILANAGSAGHHVLPESVPRATSQDTSSQALTVREPEAAAPIEWERQLEPRSVQQANWIAMRLQESRLFSAYGHASGVLATIMAGRELGFQTMASLRAFHVIDGKPTLAAGAIHSLILRSGQAKYFRCTERTAERSTFVTKRGDDPEMVLTFTIAEARQAWSKDEKAWLASGWGKNPADMLVARALTKLARLVYPDVTHGLYAPEEMD